MGAIEDALLDELNKEKLLELVPELEQTIGCQQNHPGHNLDVFNHTIKVVDLLPFDLTLRLAGLLHDIGKPEKKIIGEDGFDHFWGHEEISAQIARKVLVRLDIESWRMDTILQLIRMHDTPIAITNEGMYSAINKYGSEFIKKLLIFQRADLQAHSDSYCARKLLKWEGIYRLFITAIHEDIIS